MVFHGLLYITKFNYTLRWRSLVFGIFKPGGGGGATRPLGLLGSTTTTWFKYTKYQIFKPRNMFHLIKESGTRAGSNNQTFLFQEESERITRDLLRFSERVESLGSELRSSDVFLRDCPIYNANSTIDDFVRRLRMLQTEAQDLIELQVKNR